MAAKGHYKKIDFDQLDRLIQIGCTGEECASFFRIDYDTLNSITKREKNISFSEYVKKGNADFKVSLRRAQIRTALGSEVKDDKGKVVHRIAPSPVMQIWLGKQHLGQREIIENTVIEKPFVIELDSNED